MAERTLNQIDAEIQALTTERDLASLAGTKSIRDAMASGKAGTLADDLEALLPNVASGSMAYQQTNNLIIVLRNTKQLVESEISRVDSIAPPPSAGPTPSE